MTNTSDKYERTQQGNLLSLVGLGAFDISVDFVAINNFVEFFAPGFGKFGWFHNSVMSEIECISHYICFFRSTFKKVTRLCGLCPNSF